MQLHKMKKDKLGVVNHVIDKHRSNVLLANLGRLLMSTPSMSMNTYTHASSSGTSVGIPPLPPEVYSRHIVYKKYDQMVHNWKYSHSTDTQQLEFAARFGLVEMIRRLLTIDRNLITKCSPLSTACLSGHTEAARVLIEEFSADVNEQGMGGAHAIHDAVTSGNLSTVNVLLKHNARLDVTSGFFKETPLQTCQRYLKGHLQKFDTNYIPILRSLITHNADISKTHLLLGTTLQQDINALKNIDSELLNELTSLFSKPEPSIEALTHLMANYQINPDKMDDLISAFASLTTEDALKIKNK